MTKNNVFTVVGFRFVGEEPSVLDSGVITLEADNNNPYDANAVKVLVDNVPVGHVAKNDCVRIREYINKIKSINALVFYFASALCEFEL